MMKIFVFIFLAHITNGQLYFPEDSELKNYMQPHVNYQSTSNRLGHTKENIISKGILKLTLAVDKALDSLKQGNTDVTVYSPLGIASALALVLLGANGKTFEELSSILGLAAGLDIETSSQSVHEQIGRLLSQLQSNNNLDTGVKVNLAIGVFLQEGFPIRPVYKSTSENIYKSEIINVDFTNSYSGAIHKINNWVKDKTHDKITSILSAPPPTSTKVIICSALYFIGQWEKPFFEGITKRRPFYPYGRKNSYSVMADMMSNGGSFPYHKDGALDCEILGFPYKGNKTTMYIVMPHNSNKEKLKQLENRLTPYEIERLVSSAKYQRAVILFPKMKLESTVDLTKALQYLGAKSLFNRNEANLALLSPGPEYPTYNSNRHQFSSNFAPNLQQPEDHSEVLIFSRFAGQVSNCTPGTSSCQQDSSVPTFGNSVGIRPSRQTGGQETIDSVRKILNSNPNRQNAENPGLYADQVLHKVYMDITETGTEAAATTSVSLSRGGDVVTFRVDHPFLFFIIDEETKIVLFYGTVTTPTPSFS